MDRHYGDCPFNITRELGYGVDEAVSCSCGGVETFILVGNRYETISSTWQEREGSYEDVVQAVQDRVADGKVTQVPTEVLEVTVKRKTIIAAEVVAVEEI